MPLRLYVRRSRATHLPNKNQCVAISVTDIVSSARRKFVADAFIGQAQPITICFY
jgi:hypothetical protein